MRLTFLQLVYKNFTRFFCRRRQASTRGHILTPQVQKRGPRAEMKTLLEGIAFSGSPDGGKVILVLYKLNLSATYLEMPGKASQGKVFHFKHSATSLPGRDAKVSAGCWWCTLRELTLEKPCTHAAGARVSLESCVSCKTLPGSKKSQEVQFLPPSTVYPVPSINKAYCLLKKKKIYS